MLLLLLPSHFSHVWLCATPLTAAHQAPPSMGFARQEYWSGLPLPSPFSHIGYHKILSRVPFAIQWFSHLIVSDSCDSKDCSLLGSFVNGILQARILEWVAISFSRGSSHPRNRTQASCIAGIFFTNWSMREVFYSRSPLVVWHMLLRRFSRVRLCATPETAAHQAPPTLGFSRQEHWSGLPFPSPMHESENSGVHILIPNS